MSSKRGTLSRIETAIQRQNLLYTASSVVPRGTAILLDKFMTGIVRFARKIGSAFPVLSAATTMRTAEAVSRGTSTIYVDALLTSVPPGSIISMGDLELQFVDDSSFPDGTISLVGSLLTAYPVGTKVFLHAVPMTVTVAAAAGATSLRVSSDHLVVTGDVLLEVLSPGVGGSTVPINISAVNPVQEDMVPYTYVLSLDSPLLLSHAVGSEVHIRAFPAYKSILIPLPTQQTVLGGNVGPFLWDYLEGRLHDGIDDPTVVVAAALRSPAFTEFQPMAVISKNDVNCAVNLPGQMLGLWNIGLGKVDYVGEYPRAATDSQGDFHLFTNLVPAFPGNHTWSVSFSSSAPVTVRIGFRYKDAPESAPALPSASYVWVDALRTMYYNDTLPGGDAVTYMVVQTPAVPYDRIEVGFFDESLGGAQVIMRDWGSSCGHSTWVQYTMVGHVNGDYSWAGSGLMVKPIFLHRDALRTSDRLDSGFVAF